VFTGPTISAGSELPASYTMPWRQDAIDNMPMSGEILATPSLGTEAVIAESERFAREMGEVVVRHWHVAFAIGYLEDQARKPILN